LRPRDSDLSGRAADENTDRKTGAFVTAPPGARMASLTTV